MRSANYTGLVMHAGCEAEKTDICRFSKECYESKTSCPRKHAPLQPMVFSEPFTFLSHGLHGASP